MFFVVLLLWRMMAAPGWGRWRGSAPEAGAIARHQDALNRLGRLAGADGGHGGGDDTVPAAPGPPPGRGRAPGQTAPAVEGPPTAPGVAVPAGAAPAASPGRRRWAWDRRLRWMSAAAAAAVVAVIGLLVVMGRSPHASLATHAGAGSSAGAAAGPGHRSSASRTSTPAPPAPAPTVAPRSTAPPATAAPTTAASGPGPVVASARPAAGRPGQRITLVGRDFYSSNGVVTVRFGATEGGVSCPTRTLCRVTVPTVAGARPGRTLLLTVSTAAGTSPPVVFTYR